MHQTHFTYVSSDVVSFTKVYRSGDTIVLERSIRADVEEPTTARRYYFDTEAAAIAWYKVWKNCAIKLAGDNNPIPVRRVTVDPRTIQVYNLELVLGSVRWPVSRMLFSIARWTIDRQKTPGLQEIKLRHWGLQVKSIVSQTPSSFTIASVTTTWIWTLKGSQITISTIIASQPDWFHSFELVFSDAKSSKAWFTYLKTCGVGNMPCEQHVKCL